MAGGESGRSAEPSYGRDSRATILGQHGKVWVQGLSMRLLLSVALATFVGLAAAHEQVYPSRPVTMIVPFPAGGSTDAIARHLVESKSGQGVAGDPYCGIACRRHPVPKRDRHP